MAYSDADYNTDPHTRPSVSGSCALMHGSLVSWRAKQQGCVATSTTHAEYMALYEACKDVVWLRRIISNSGHKYEMKHATTIYEDNKSTIALATNPLVSERSKHIDTGLHYVREMVDKQVVCIQQVHTDDNPADILTKDLAREELLHHLRFLGLGYL